MENYDSYENQFYTLLGIAKNRALQNEDPKKVEEGYKNYLSKIKLIREEADKNRLQFLVPVLEWVKEFETEHIEKYLDGDDLKNFRSVKSIIKYPQFKVMGEALGKIILGNRIKCYNSLAKTLEYKNFIEMTPKKTLIFSNYVSVCTNAVAKCRIEGYNPLGVYGEHTKNLDSIVAKFTDPKSNVNPLVATYKSLSTGVQLTVANIMICLDIPFRHYIFDQAVSRVHRLPQDRKVYIFIIKLDTGDEFNITDRDLFILNLSQLRVYLITRNEIPYDIPKQDLSMEKEEEIEEDNKAIDIIKKDIMESIEDELSGIFKSSRNLFNNFIEDIKQKIKLVFK